MWSYPDIEKYILKQTFNCICPPYFTDSEYLCPFCFTFTVHNICIQNIDNY